jgi:hypothetical protein
MQPDHGSVWRYPTKFDKKVSRNSPFGGCTVPNLAIADPSISSACSRRAHAVGRRVSLGPQLTPQTPIRSALPRMREVLRKEGAWST